MELTDPLINTSLTFLIAVAITVISIPTIVKVAKIKQLVDIPNGRTSHNGMIPSLGGFATFTAISIAILTLANFQINPYSQYFLGGILIIFFIGLKDDILVIDPYKKLLGQVAAAGLVVFLGDVYFTNLHGFLGIYQISPIIGSLLTIFVVIVITNSFNLIDGIDGLAAGIGILTSLALGIWFYYIGQYQLAIISVAITGAYLGFFLFNVSKGENKIFMGDTGSLILGFGLAYLIVHFNELNLVGQKMNISSAPAVSFGILIVPLFDTLRVFLLRVLRGKSPFNPDKQHVHHRLLHLFDSHRKTTITILLFNLIFIGLVFLLQNLAIIELMLIEVVIAGIFSYLPVMIIRKKENRPILSFDSDWMIHPEILNNGKHQEQAKTTYTRIDV
ncbi:MAG: MraY family glycosyltransferase [Bacteroidales bacterium]|nr:undecaprenyl/decaprenyl-phosphate alpha-N-acetylglucosaminyl 1-phosphate transferase [Bacteroidales bacterium]MBS3776346.1 undecaprenyl/decaprenyl-phosphate alpha-N-acetylglucosaminyl 1-phosphate transferase [Bacteroidales bacterium]